MGEVLHQLPFCKNIMTLSRWKYMYLNDSCEAVILMAHGQLGRENRTQLASEFL
jgi:hypothetical protein